MRKAVVEVTFKVELELDDAVDIPDVVMDTFSMNNDVVNDVEVVAQEIKRIKIVSDTLCPEEEKATA